MALNRESVTPKAKIHSSPGGTSGSPLVLVVGFPDSVHTARWLNMMRGRGIRFVLVPVYFISAIGEFGRTRLISDAQDLARLSDREVGIFNLESVPAAEIAAVQSGINYHPWQPQWLSNLQMAQAGHVVSAIRLLRPDVLHSMVVQFGGYLSFAARQYLKEAFPVWLLSNWGSDIFLYRKLPDHRGRIQEILSAIDGYHAECERDLRIARQMGFRRFAFPIVPASGGMDFSNFHPLDAFERPSNRREILVKGYQNWAGRAINTLAAIHLAADALRDYRIRVTLSERGVYDTALTMAEVDGLDISIEPYLERHDEALLRLSKARLAIGMGISDGISTTLLESMAVGTFPIQGSNSCGSEWIECGKTGMLVAPHDVEGLAAAIRRAASDDSLVDSAAISNRGIVEARWNSHSNGEILAQNYRALLEWARDSRPREQSRSGVASLHA